MNLRHLASIFLFCLLLAPMTAEAQLSTEVGVTERLSRAAVGSAAIKGTDSGYDPINDAYLVVGSCYNGACGYGEVYGVYVSRAGATLTSPFSISGGSAGHFPRVRYSAQLNSGQGGFLVTWLREGSSGQNSVLVRRVVYPGVALGTAVAVNDGASYAWIESAAAVGYSAISQRFLVAWRTYPSVSSPAHVAARLVDINGTAVESVLRLSAGFGRDPGVAWNSTANLFGVSFGGENSAGSAGFSGFVVVPPVNGAAFTRNSFNAISGFTYISDVDFNPDSGNFVMIWHQYTPGVPFEVRAAELNTGAQVVSEGMVSRELPGYDAHSIAFNPISRTFVVASIDAADDIVVAELNARGVRTSPVTLVGPGVTGRYPRIATSTELAQFNITLSNGFLGLNNLLVRTTSTNGGASGGGGGSGSGCTTPQPGPDWICSNGSWVPGGSGGGSTGGCTTPKPGADWTCVNGSWLPGGSGGGSTGSCTTPRPGADWTCVNGSWLPGGSGGASTGSCTTPRPGADWTCVNGGWLPGGSGGGSTSSCTTPQPGTGWTCSNGNWLPPGIGGGGGGTSGCTTVQPGVGWTCVNGGWLPPGAGGGSSGGGSSCTTPQPGVGWTCSAGNWLPPGAGGGCTTVQPGPSWICVNGGWIPGQP